MTDLEERKLLARCKKADDAVRNALALLDRQAASAPELTFAKVAEILSAMRDVDNVLLQHESHAFDYDKGAMPGAAGVKQKAWKHTMTWRLFVRRYASSAHCDRAGTNLHAVIVEVLDTLKLPMPDGLESLAQQIDA